MLNYAAEIWGAHDAPDIEVIHTKICRKFLTVKRSTNPNALYGERMRVPMLIHRKIIMIKYWLKILSLHNHSLLFRTYQMFKSNLENGSHCDKTNWANQIRNFLQECGLFYIWQNQSNMPFNLSTIKQRFFDIFYQSWYSNNSSRLETYSLIKHTFNLDFVKEKSIE